MKPTLPLLVTQDLGYCCVWVFFQRFNRTSVIARRLGLEPRTVRAWRAKVTNGQLACAGCPNCMKDKLTK